MVRVNRGVLVCPMMVVPRHRGFHPVLWQVDVNHLGLRGHRKVAVRADVLRFVERIPDVVRGVARVGLLMVVAVRADVR